MLDKIKFWLITKKKCHSCCLTCPYYNDCRTDLIGEKVVKEIVSEKDVEKIS